MKELLRSCRPYVVFPFFLIISDPSFSQVIYHSNGRSGALTCPGHKS